MFLNKLMQTIEEMRLRNTNAPLGERYRPFGTYVDPRIDQRLNDILSKTPRMHSSKTYLVNYLLEMALHDVENALDEDERQDPLECAFDVIM